MIFDFRINDRNQIEWRETNEDRYLCLVGVFKRVSQNMTINIAHFVHLCTAETWWVLDGLVSSMTDRSGDHKSQFGADHGVPKIVRYHQPVLVHQSWMSDKCHLLDLNGKPMAGSNMHDHNGKLCLGETANPMTLQPVEALIGKTANNDLSWKHDKLQGKWETVDGFKFFNVNTWPTAQSAYKTVPKAVQDAARRLRASSSPSPSPR